MFAITIATKQQDKAFDSDDAWFGKAGKPG
jgi:hypothetical protein